MGIHDPIEADDPTKWFPSNLAATQLVACVLACKDVTKLLLGLDRHDPISDRRGFIMLLTPAISLLLNVLKLNAMLGRNDISKWPKEDRDSLSLHGKLLKKRSSGPLRLLRNERSAHQDPDKFSDFQARARAQIPSAEILDLLRESFVVLIHRMNHKQAFAWSRFPEPSRADLIEVQQEGSIGPVKVLANSDMEIVNIIGFERGDPALLAAKAIVDKSIAEYNLIAKMCSPQIPALHLRERDIPGY